LGYTSDGLIWGSPIPAALRVASDVIIFGI
jgi:hypothetical protein